MNYKFVKKFTTKLTVEYSTGIVTTERKGYQVGIGINGKEPVLVDSAYFSTESEFIMLMNYVKR